MSELTVKERTEIESHALDRAFQDLRKAHIPCAKIPRIERRRAGITGKYRGEPYMVYVNFIGRGKEYAAQLITRFKGKDWWNMEPYKLLKREG